MSSTTTLESRLTAAIALIESNATIFQQLVQGDSNTVVTTINGTVSSVAKRISEIMDPAIAQTQTLRDQAETFKNEAETARTQAQEFALLPLGTENQIIKIVDSKPAWSSNPPKVTEVQGDMVTLASTGNARDSRLPIGTEGQVLKVSATLTSGLIPRWGLATRQLFYVTSGDKLFYISTNNPGPASGTVVSGGFDNPTNARPKVFFGITHIHDSHYNRNTGIFTVPVTGNYRFEVYFNFIDGDYTTARAVSNNVPTIGLFRNGSILDFSDNEGSFLGRKVFHYRLTGTDTIYPSLITTSLTLRSFKVDGDLTRDGGALHSFNCYYLG